MLPRTVRSTVGRDTGDVHADAFDYFDEPFACLAHRGGYLEPADAGRENTLHAFRRAHDEAGYRYLETDIHLSADGVLVAFHDDRLDRVTDRTGLIARLPLREIKAARVAGVDEIPTLDELLEELPDARFNIDIKQSAAVEPLVACLRAHRAERRVCVASFNPARLSRFRRLAGPGIATSSSVPGVAWAAYLASRRMGGRQPAAVYQVPTHQVIAGRLVPVLTRKLLRTAHAAGQRVHVWTVNDEAAMHRLIDLGVDGIITDRIGLLKTVAQAHGLWTPGGSQARSEDHGALGNKADPAAV